MNVVQLSFESAFSLVADVTHGALRLESVMLPPRGPFDAEISMQWNGEHRELPVCVKSSTTSASLAQLEVITQRSEGVKWLLLSSRIAPAIRKELRQRAFNYLDEAGNCYLNLDGSIILIEGQKKDRGGPSANRSRVFQKSGLKLVLQLLAKESRFESTYREMSVQSGISLGSVKYIVDGLEGLGFIRRTGESEYRFIEREGLLHAWAESYDQVLRPSVSRGRFMYVVGQERKAWSETWMGHHAYWSGMGAAFRKKLITTDPERLTLYTSLPLKDLRNVFHIVQDDYGDLEIIQAFWDEGHDDPDQLRTGSFVTPNAPFPVVYADLIRVGDPRLNEVAQSLRNDYLKSHD